MTVYDGKLYKIVEFIPIMQGLIDQITIFHLKASLQIFFLANKEIKKENLG